MESCVDDGGSRAAQPAGYRVVDSDLAPVGWAGEGRRQREARVAGSGLSHLLWPALVAAQNRLAYGIGANIPQYSPYFANTPKVRTPAPFLLLRIVCCCDSLLEQDSEHYPCKAYTPRRKEG